MKLLLRSNDPVLLSWAEAMLRDAGVEPFLLDVHTSALEGSIAAIPRRIAVRAEDHARARSALIEAGAPADILAVDGDG